jgi:hypothetical protein
MWGLAALDDLRVVGERARDFILDNVIHDCNNIAVESVASRIGVTEDVAVVPSARVAPIWKESYQTGLLGLSTDRNSHEHQTHKQFDDYLWLTRQLMDS